MNSLKKNRKARNNLTLILGLLLSVQTARASELLDTPELRRSQVPFPSKMINHGQGMVELAPGKLMLCWYSGKTEAGKDVRILCSRSSDYGVNWSEPQTAVEAGEKAAGAREVNKSLGNVTFAHDASNRLWMIYGVIQQWNTLFGNLCRSWSCGRVDARISTDQGESWSSAVRMDDQVGALARAKTLHHPTLGDLIPLYLEGKRESYVRILNLSTVPVGSIPGGVMIPISASEGIQPSLVLMPDGKVRAYLRSQQGKVLTSVLDPATIHWSEVRSTGLANPDAAVDAWMDEHGRVVIVYNPSTQDRTTLRLASSLDGEIFTEGCDLVADKSDGDVAYPYVIRDAQGSWNITYSARGKSEIRHVRFNAAWLNQCLATSPAHSQR